MPQLDNTWIQIVPRVLNGSSMSDLIRVLRSQLPASTAILHRIISTLESFWNKIDRDAWKALIEAVPPITKFWLLERLIGYGPLIQILRTAPEELVSEIHHMMDGDPSDYLAKALKYAQQRSYDQVLEALTIVAYKEVSLTTWVGRNRIPIRNALMKVLSTEDLKRFLYTVIRLRLVSTPIEHLEELALSDLPSHVTTTIRDYLAELDTCGICQGVNQLYTYGPCLHAICNDCLCTIISQQQIAPKCPYCKRSMDVKITKVVVGAIPAIKCRAAPSTSTP